MKYYKKGKDAIASDLDLDLEQISKEKYDILTRPTLEEQLINKEREYDMSRWQREGILAEGSAYSDYAKAKAQELEDLAEQIRQKNGGNL